jgi:protein-S-isoprenylcysteine O-methyltransferase Ste14
MSALSIIFVMVQFVCLGALFLTGPVFPVNGFLMIPALLALLLMLWSIGVMTGSKLNVFPEIRSGANLIRLGPYRFLRHPMYLTLMLYFGALVADKFSLFRLLLFLILITDLILKIEYEEKLLIAKFPEYKAYREKSWKVIPFLF